MKGSVSILLSILMFSTALAGCASNDSISQTNDDVDELQKNQDEMSLLLEALINENIALNSKKSSFLKADIRGRCSVWA